MNRTMRTAVYIFTATFVLLGIMLASSAYAACTPTVKPGESIQDAIETTSTNEICIGVGTYEEDIVLKSGVTLRGEELARTIIDGGGSGAVVTAASNTTILNLTLKNGSAGVLLDAADIGVVVSNVIITDTNTAIDCTACEVTIDHAVIEKNTVGIDMAEQVTGLPEVTLRNSMLVGNVTDVRSDQTTISFTEALHNLLFDNTTENYPEEETTSVRGTNADPFFVGRASNDYHVKVDSPAIDAGTGENDLDGTTADIGAYGGSRMDTTPFPVANIRATKVDDSTLDVSWNINEAYTIDGYKVYFGQSEGSYNGTSNEGPSPVNVPGGDVDSLQLTGLQGNPTGTAPADLSWTPGDGKLRVSWTAVTGATGYRVSYGTSGEPPTIIEAGTSTSIVISGLTNNTPYDITVSALFETVYYITVAAFVTIGSQEIESELVNQTSETLQDESEGPSASTTGTPEEVVPFPPLEDEDRCFIATAAFGSTLEPHVKLLRTFRDRYLLTNGPGRQLVSWYYAASPPIADFIRSHEGIRAVVRTVLLPVVWAVSFFMKPYGPVLSLMLFLTIVVLSLRMFRWRALS